jgi:hypothetical protein
MSSRTIRPLALLAALIAGACTDQPATEPSALVPTGPAVMELYDPPLVVDVLQRSTPLPESYSASAVIGREGGTIAIPEAGFRIDFPANALKGKPTLITVTALAGNDVAYLFEPHGLVFHQNPMITQDLKATAAWQDPSIREDLEGAHFPDLTYLNPDGTARIKETRPTVIDVSGWKMKFNVHHFSGYLAARKGGYIGSSGDRIPTTASTY